MLDTSEILGLGGMEPYVVRIVSVRKNAGKTTIGVSLVRELVLKGVKVAAIKHAHSGVDLSKDTAKYLSSGADIAVAVGPLWSALYVRNEALDLGSAINMLPGEYRIIIVEGFKKSNIGEVLAVVNSPEELSKLRNTVTGKIVAVVTSYSYTGEAPSNYTVFNHGDMRELAEFIIERAEVFALSQTPGLNCGHCGYSTCAEFSKAYILGKAVECPVISDVELVVNGRKVPLSPFVKTALKNTVLGFITSLKNIPKDPSKIKELEFRIK